jgi:hypothetical protein
MGEVSAYSIVVGNPEGKTRHLYDLDVDGKIMLAWILTKYGGKVASGLG